MIAMLMLTSFGKNATLFGSGEKVVEFLREIPVLQHCREVILRLRRSEHVGRYSGDLLLAAATLCDAANRLLVNLFQGAEIFGLVLVVTLEQVDFVHHSTDILHQLLHFNGESVIVDVL